MRSIVTIDRQSADESVAIWVTSRGGSHAVHANAVVIESDDPMLVEKVRSLTRCAVVLVTAGTTLDGFPVDGMPLSEEHLHGFIAEIEEHRSRISSVVADYKRKSRSRTLTEPEFPAISPVDGADSHLTASERAFALANEVMRLWSAWLETDEERRKRTVQPRTGLTPWVMPIDMNNAKIPDFPDRFLAAMTVQSVV
ncbi:hypothetical protein [Nocardioides cavernaquae]|uniref:Uncharacterized protein n=1 Tax=Nocardioides cavernaquae TaxID=2321396 RepID=A0A3A5HBH1_9ACTN|nr:hypothetical protein [Nocardioides cavernaquae]RJS45327.1 hypothetical protein D4739_03255 [Nocardioides cavernaquae]